MRRMFIYILLLSAIAGCNDVQIPYYPPKLVVEGWIESGGPPVVAVRFCTMDNASYQYWEDYDDVSSLSLNPFFPVTKKIRSNIKGGLGYWAGYGTSYYYIDCQ